MRKKRSHHFRIRAMHTKIIVSELLQGDVINSRLLRGGCTTETQHTCGLSAEERLLRAMFAEETACHCEARIVFLDPLLRSVTVRKHRKPVRVLRGLERERVTAYEMLNPFVGFVTCPPTRFHHAGNARYRRTVRQVLRSCARGPACVFNVIELTSEGPKSRYRGVDRGESRKIYGALLHAFWNEQHGQFDVDLRVIGAVVMVRSEHK